MTTATDDRVEAERKKRDTELRHAMLSVYYRSLGGQLETQGAPAVAVPPEVRPLPLDEALDRIARDGKPEQLWEAYWRIVRSVPVMGWVQGDLARRYPSALVERLEPEAVARLDKLRQDTCESAHLLAAALGELAAPRPDEAHELADLLKGSTDRLPEAVGRTIEDMLGSSMHDLVTEFVDEPEAKVRNRRVCELRKLPGQVGLNFNTFAEDFLDTVAFTQFMNDQGVADELADLTLTSSSIVRQDTNSLTTTATVTALARTDFEVLAKVLDPLAWPKCSDVIRKTYYVDAPDDPYTRSKSQPDIGQGFKESRYLFENVHITWGDDDVQSGGFRNVLVIDGYKVCRERQTISLRFRLCRSIDSRMLWDERVGGILIDGGFVVVRPVRKDGPYRMTARKVLRFSDRTPYSSAPGFLDFGEMLNVMTPAAVTWWLETDLCSARCMRKAQKRHDRSARREA
jgi:hypothetical protein